MKIQIIKLQKKEFALTWAKSIKVLVIIPWFFGIVIDFGIKYREGIEEKRKNWIKNALTKSCAVCGLPLNANNVHQIVSYHKECRPFRHDKLSDEKMAHLVLRVKLHNNV